MPFDHELVTLRLQRTNQILGTRGFQPKNAGTNWGWHKFMSHDTLFDAGKGYLHDDKLVVKSDVSMLASVTATAGVIPSPASTLAADLAAIQYGQSIIVERENNEPTAQMNEYTRRYIKWISFYVELIRS